MTALVEAISRKAALYICSPVFRLLEYQLQSDEYSIQYRGDGEFEYVGPGSERKIGQFEAYISIVPTVYLLLPFAGVYLLTPRTLWAVGMIAVFGFIVVLSMGVIGQVSVDHVRAGDNA